MQLTGTLRGIQYLRAVAALLVCYTHVTYFYPGGPYRFEAGEGGVDIFFVISGLVMWLTGRSLSSKDFVVRRVARVVPLYWSVTLYTAFVSWTGGPHIEFWPSMDDFVTSMLFIANRNDDRNTFIPVLGVGWTLNYELYFYAVFALGLASLIHDARFRARSGHLLRLAVLRGRPASLAFVSPHSD